MSGYFCSTAEVPFYSERKRKSCWVTPLLNVHKQCCWMVFRIYTSSMGRDEPAPKVLDRVVPMLTPWSSHTARVRGVQVARSSCRRVRK